MFSVFDEFFIRRCCIHDYSRVGVLRSFPPVLSSVATTQDAMLSLGKTLTCNEDLTPPCIIRSITVCMCHDHDHSELCLLPPDLEPSFLLIGHLEAKMLTSASSQSLKLSQIAQKVRHQILQSVLLVFHLAVFQSSYFISRNNVLWVDGKAEAIAKS